MAHLPPEISSEALALSVNYAFTPVEVQRVLDGCGGDYKRADEFLQSAAALRASPVGLMECAKDVADAFRAATEAFRKVGEAAAQFVSEEFPGALERAQRRYAIFLELEEAERKAERFRREVLSKIKPGPLSEIRQRFRSS